MSNIILPKSLQNDFLSKWQGRNESIGYTIAYKKDLDLVCLISIRTGIGNSYEVKEYKGGVLADLTMQLKQQNFDILPSHSHPISGLSPKDKDTLEFLAKFGYHNTLVIESDTIKSYNTTKKGLISVNPVIILPDNPIFQKYSEQYTQLRRKLLEK